MKERNRQLILAAVGACIVAAGCNDNSAGPSASNGGSSGNGTAGAGAAAGKTNSAGTSSAGNDATSGDAGSNSAGAGGEAEAAQGGADSLDDAPGSAGTADDGGSAGAAPIASGRMDGYVLFSTADAANNFIATQMIDMDGNVVHTWNIGGQPSRLLPGGDLVGCSGLWPDGEGADNFLQVSWAGDTKWSYSGWATAADGTLGSRQHHDFQLEGNPVGYYAPGQTYVVGGGSLVLAHSIRSVPDVRDGNIDDDAIYEIDGNGVFKDTLWLAGDHIAELGFDADALNDIRTRTPGTTLQWLHGNSMSLVGPNHWFDEGHTEFDPNNIIYSSRNAGFVVIISRDTGKVVWRIGPDFSGRPEATLGQFIGQHNPHIIPKGLPGAGDMIVFDNGGPSGYGGPANTYRYSRGWSRVVEFDPITMQIVWQFGSETGADNIYSPYVSNTQRLPNGNTQITIGVSGRIIEVNPDNEIVWQYQYVPPAGLSAWIYRAYRIPPEWLPAGVNAAHASYANWAELAQ